MPRRETFSITCQAFANRMTSATVFVLRARYTEPRFGSFQVAYLDFLFLSFFLFFLPFLPRESSKTSPRYTFVRFSFTLLSLPPLCFPTATRRVMRILNIRPLFANDIYEALSVERCLGPTCQIRYFKGVSHGKCRKRRGNRRRRTERGRRSAPALRRLPKPRRRRRVS